MKTQSLVASEVAVQEYRKWIAELKTRYRATQIYDMYSYLQQVAEDNQVADLMKVPWGHHILLLGKCKGDQNKALFYVRKTLEGGWSRTDLSVAINERLYEKTGKAMGVARYKLTQRPPKGLAEIKKAVDKLGVVVDEIFMGSKTTSNCGPASKGKEIPNG